MDQNESKRSQEQEQMARSSYDVHVDGQGPTLVGDHSTLNQDQRHTFVNQLNVVNVFPSGNGAYIYF